jgi:hypothetical protein
VLGPLFALALAIELCVAMLGSALQGVKHNGAPYVRGFGTPGNLGTLFLTKYLFPFEVASILLLVAAIGAVVLARRRRGLEEPEEPPLRIRTTEPDNAGTMAEAAGVRPTAYDELTEPEVEPVAGSSEPSSGGW